ncbi:MAG: hypothetical protein GWM98_12205 [Nitrospinaceae bacterium]|nr:hypothetical protein [Nitrospinaceae bacterium]NIR55115.1 hypothetical protein [Nitrospinaceae bacterium]NIS85536.1 hypothetical protein [Nitrospinaceae bacterium]NIT82370.1 hypothetical protein [Nitrospinaceae bacterium]NIU44583.1 hypothetical protein [Nitrospinaceae bacterium]
MEKTLKKSCEECGRTVDTRPTVVDYQGQEIFVFHPVICRACLLKLCERFAVRCANCGGPIPPFTQVGVHPGTDSENRFVHMNPTCSTVGSAFHGYWGKGKLYNSVQIEAC